MIFKDICRFGLLSAFQKYIINLCTMKNKAVRVFLLGEGRIFEIFWAVDDESAVVEDVEKFQLRVSLKARLYHNFAE